MTDELCRGLRLQTLITFPLLAGDQLVRLKSPPFHNQIRSRGYVEEREGESSICLGLKLPYVAEVAVKPYLGKGGGGMLL